MYAGIDLQAMSAEFLKFPGIPVSASGSRIACLSRGLADVTAECLGIRKDGTPAHDIVGKRIMVCVLCRRTPRAAYEHIERLDHICEIVLKSGVAARSSGQS